ncbi:MAG: glycosyltransferase family 1 protein [Pseudomonadota bacterium]
MTIGSLTGQAWEQIDLPRAETGDLLVNLCNLSPLASRNSITMMHDAQVFSTPDSYSRAFRLWYRFAQPRIGRKASRILTVSHYSAEQLVGFGITDPDKISVVHNGVDHILDTPPTTKTLDEYELSDRNFTVGLANTQAHKNVRVLIEAYRRPELQNQKLVLFGSADEAAFRDADLPLTNNIILVGRISDNELRGLLERATALVFPSKTEGFGLPPLEAMTLGTPVICADAGALPEVCGAVPIYADPDDVDAWVAAIVELTDEDPNARTARAMAARNHASAYTWAEAGRKLLEVVDTTLTHQD